MENVPTKSPNRKGSDEDEDKDSGDDITNIKTQIGNDSSDSDYREPYSLTRILVIFAIALTTGNIVIAMM